MTKVKIPKTEPLYEGPAGRAWAFDLVAMRAHYPDQRDATLGCWCIFCPSAHPLWHSYAMFVIHLRDEAGIPPVNHRHVEGATHEMWLYALDPDWAIKLAPKRVAIHCLQPINFAAQFKAPTDADAVKFCLRAVVDIVNGDLNPDTDGRKQWTVRFGDGMFKK